MTEIDSYVICDGEGCPEDFVRLVARLVETPEGRLAVCIDSSGAKLSVGEVHGLVSVLGFWDSRVAVRDASFQSGQYSLDV